MIGQTVGKYRVQDRIGRGGMGTVYLATDETLRREVAIKVLNSELNDPEIARRFRSEAITVARLSHPGIATVYELFEHDGQWLMVMEFVRGETLEKTIEKSGPMPVERAVDLVIQGLTALAHAHSMGVVHRDLKPANLMVTPTGTVKIMDFGIARVAGSEHLTAAGFMMGTPAYMAPEQVMGHEIDARADLYAMGVVLYRLTTAKLPFKGETPFAMAQSQVNDPPTPVRLMRSELPIWIEQVISRALSKAPVDRFQTADEFREALKRGLAGLPIETMSVPFVPPELLMTTPMPISGDTSPQARPAAVAPPAPAPAPPQSGSTAATAMISGSMPMPSGSMPSGAMPSGATAASAPSPSATPANAAPATSTTPTTTSTTSASVAAPPAKRNTTTWLVAAVVLLTLGIGGTLWYRKHAAAVAASAAASAPTPAETPAVPPPQPITPDVPPTVVPPAGADVNANAAASGATNAAPPPTGGVASTDPNAASASGTTGRGGAIGTSGAPARGATGVATPAANAATPGRPTPATPEGEAHLAYGDVKILAVTDKKGQDQDVVLNFVAGQISVAPRKGGNAILSVPYNRIAHMTYVHAKDPKWYPDPTLSMPPDGLDIPGFMRGARHWLVLQTRTNYLILRLDDSDFSQILDTVESRTGIKVDRPAPGK